MSLEAPAAHQPLWPIYAVVGAVVLLIAVPFGLWQGNEQWGWFDTCSQRFAREFHAYVEHAKYEPAIAPFKDPC